MSASAQMMLRDYAGRKWPTMNHKGRITRLSRLLEWGHRRVRAVYNNESGGRLRADEMAAIEALQGEADRNAFQALQERVARLEAALAHVDEAFFDPQMAGLSQAVDGRRRDYGAGNPDTETETD